MPSIPYISDNPDTAEKSAKNRRINIGGQEFKIGDKDSSGGSLSRPTPLENTANFLRDYGAANLIAGTGNFQDVSGSDVQNLNTLGQKPGPVTDSADPNNPRVTLVDPNAGRIDEGKQPNDPNDPSISGPSSPIPSGPHIFGAKKGNYFS